MLLSAQSHWSQTRIHTYKQNNGRPPRLLCLLRSRLSHRKRMEEHLLNDDKVMTAGIFARTRLRNEVFSFVIHL